MDLADKMTREFHESYAKTYEEKHRSLPEELKDTLEGVSEQVMSSEDERHIGTYDWSRNPDQKSFEVYRCTACGHVVDAER